MNIADEAKLCSPIHSPFEALVLSHAVRRCHREELSPVLGPILTVGVAVFGASHRFAEPTSQM